MSTQLKLGTRVQIKQLDYLKPCLQGKHGFIEDITQISKRERLYSVRLDHPDPIGLAVVEESELNSCNQTT